MLNRAATDAALNPKRGAPKRATGQQIAFLQLSVRSLKKEVINIMLKKSKKQLDDSNKGVSEPGPQVQEATEE